MATLTIELPEGVLSTLHKSTSDVEREMRLALAIEWYRRGEMSQGRAAELARLPRADFIDELAARKIDVIQVDLDDLRREIELA